MSSILAITSSALGAASVSNQLVSDTVEALRAGSPSTNVRLRDLGEAPVPHLTALDLVPEPATGEQRALRSLSDELIAELQAADTLVIGAPMYNFGIPSTLKAWFDRVLRAGVTFRYTNSGPEGLLRGKRAFVVLSRGGLYSEGPAQAMDAQEPHLRTLLGFIGITDVTFIRAEKLAMGTEERAGALAAAEARIAEAVRRPAALAA
ncbi:FMN-dependent NADH-azoreductase [Amaricoccus solimangrovi]|uniref:FMN dependent NADH:quinone oxidoreductase n=1 Tax=Amaricoccus solimangrovi TaxID=2589815 RepID=A0A501WLI9_9RHOB|nr:FMN-dependent NADH-azoreductase [Amaricoccus solimangrovi]TPE49270.1 FMN-dependent NADH-azoreductase [Amaricoccus solimangrovi]